MAKSKKLIDQQDFDLIGILYSLWNKKLIIILSSVLFVTIGYYYSTTFKDKYETHLDILPISLAEEENYYLLNSIGLVDGERKERLKITDNFSNPNRLYTDDSITNDLLGQMLEERRIVVSGEFKITRGKLLEMFIDEMISGESLFEALRIFRLLRIEKQCAKPTQP